MATEARLIIDEDKLNATMMPRLEAFLARFVRRVESEAKTAAPARTGNLKRLIRADPVRRVGPWRLDSGVTSHADYSAPVHEGARPHLIVPRNARALRFVIGNRVIFSQRVNHPGNRPQPFLRNAAHTVASGDPHITMTGL